MSGPARRRWLAAPALFAAASSAHAITLGSADTDRNSFANVDEFRTTHLELIIDVDFKNRELDGNAVLEMQRLDPKSTQVVLDTQGLNILTVSELSSNFFGATEKMKPIWVAVPFHLGKTDPVRGSPLYVDVAASKEPLEVIKIEYETTAASRALHWRSPVGPDSKLIPFLYTTSGGIGARSWIPLQDTPQVRMAYKALIRTSDDVLAVMGAANDPRMKHNGNYTFVMSQQVPSYTLALGVGRLDFRATGPRSGVYAEKSILKAAAREFASTEAMMAAAEKILGSYQWQRFDQLVAPADFAVGAVPNTSLEFVSPTLVGGDGSLVAPLAFGIGHAWAGALVSNATWSDRWLNDALSRYLQQRILEEVWGESRAAIDAVLDFDALREAVSNCGAADQSLGEDDHGRDLDEGCADVPAAKGALFLHWLELRFGREHFDEFLRGYFDHFAWDRISTEEFTDYLTHNLLERFPGVVTTAQVTAWLTEPGLPDDAPVPTSGALAAVDAARSEWTEGKLPAKKLDARAWVPRQWVYFLAGLPATLTAAQLAELDKAFSLTSTPDALLASTWLQVVIRNNYQPSYARLDEFLRNVGRARYIVPLYRELAKTPGGAAVARREFTLARAGYDPGVEREVAAIVKPEAGDRRH
jgi:aminopeptidase N